ncbi:MAG TPA: TonB-dependent receptor [Cytophagales bacterium]|jgi:iron complex outermembrane recepter protein|nr:TonB-dependent receptor [Cytophagales bacterium]
MSKFFTLILISTAFSLSGQNWVSGIVMDAETRQPLAHCHLISLPSNKIAIADETGQFKIESNSGERIVFSFIGYTSDTLVVENVSTFYSVTLQPKRAELDEVVVTAIARSSLIKENPISIFNVTPKMIERAIENNVMDALAKNTPGMNTLKSGPNISKPFIRGMGFNRVLTLYDGVRQEGQQWGGEHGLEIDNYNIERAEVIKGPASLVYGSDALAGVVSLLPFIPNESDKKIYGKWISEYQSNNGLTGNGFRISQGTSHWLWALRGSYRLAKNYSNRVDGTVYNTGFQEKNISGLLGYKSSKGFTHLNLSLYDNLQGIPDGSRDSLSRKFTKQIYEGSNDNLKTRPIVTADELNSYQLSPLHQRIQHYRAYLKSHYEIKGGDIQSLIAFTQNIRREFNHPTDIQQAGTYLRLNTINYSFRYNAAESHNIELSVGTNGMFQNNKIKEATAFPIPDYDLVDFGAYTLAKWKNEKWSVIGGARFDSRQVKTKTMYVGQDSKTGFDIQVSPPDTVGAVKQFSALNQKFHGVTLSLGSTYQINSHFNAKVNLSRGYRAPSMAEIASNGLDAGAHIIYIGNSNFQSEFSWQEDVGLFATFNEVAASVSVFNKNIQNYIYLNQVTDTNGHPITDAQGNKTIQYQQASAQLYGLEATLAIKPKAIPGLTFNNQLSVCYGFNRNPLFENKKQQGEYLPFIPPARLVSNLTKEFSLNSKRITNFSAQIEADINATQNRFLALYNTETKTNGYTLINAGTAATFFKNWQVQFQVNNLLDIAYQSNMSRLKYFEYYSQSPNGGYGIYGMGRNYCVKIIFSF